MKRLNITFGTILLVLGCFAFSPAAQADPPIPRSPFSIVGTWHVQVFFDPGHTQLLFESYKQWHSDGLEFESANIGPGVLCVGTWKQMAPNTVQALPRRMDLRQPCWDLQIRVDRNRNRQPRRQ